MPEGAELKISSDIIKPLVQGKLLVNCFPSKTGRYRDQNPEGFDQLTTLPAMKVEDVKVKGKFMYWKLVGEKENYYLFCTYGMTGQWSTQETKHTCFTVQLLDINKFAYNAENLATLTESLHFNDPRHFGTIKFANEAELNEKLNSLGWDPLEESMSTKLSFLKKKIKKAKSIGEILLDQKVFAGCGNYVRAEALYRAGINPWTQGNSLTDNQVINLCQHVKDVLQESYQAQGASFNSYVNANGNAGKYSFNFQVYAQNTDPLGNPIKRETMGTRTIHWCPSIQK